MSKCMWKLIKTRWNKVCIGSDSLSLTGEDTIFGMNEKLTNKTITR